jgi:hypothetical protein
MASVLNAVVSQGMITSSKKGLQLFCDTPPEFKTLSVFGDSSRVQQVGRFGSAGALLCVSTCQKTRNNVLLLRALLGSIERVVVKSVL